jgi:peptidyl-prolyl cis-trans isomerase B (cyclophilin B)
MMRSFGVLALLAVSVAPGAGGAQQAGGGSNPAGGDMAWPPVLPASLEPAALILESEDRRFAVDGLLDLTASPDTGTRSRAALALGRVGSPGLLPRLIELSRDPETVVRAAAAFALGRLEYERAASTEGAERTLARDALLPLLDESADLVAEQAAWSLGLVDGGALTAVADWLHRASRSTPATRPNPAVLAALLNSWWRLGGADASAMRPFTGWAVATVRLAAAHSLRRLGDPNALPQLMALIDDPDVEVRLMAVRGLRGAPQRVAESNAARLLNTRDRRLQCEALAWLEATWELEGGTAGNDAFVAVLRRTLDRDLHVRSCALRALGVTISSRGVASDRLLEALEEEEEGVRLAAIQGLVRASGKPLQEAIIRTRRRVGIEGATGLGAVLVEYLNESRLEAVWFARALSRSVESVDQSLAAELLRSGPRPVRAALLSELEDRAPAEAYQVAFNLVGGELEEEALNLIARQHRASFFDNDTELPVQLADRLWRRYYDQRGSELRGLRLAALRALSAIQRELVVRRLSLIRDEPDRFVRFAALDVLGGGPEIRSVLQDTEALLAPHATGRDHAIYVELAERVLTLQSQSTRLRLQTDRGDVVIELRPDWAPLSVVQLIDLMSTGFFVDSRFDRVIAGFVTQGGGSADGSLAPALRNEDSPIGYVRGSVGLAHTGRDSARSQFFVAHAAQPHLTGEYPMVGRVVDGQRAIELTQPGDQMRIRLDE